MGNWFDEKMSSDELYHALFSITKEQCERQKDEIRKEYNEVLPVITKRESELAQEGWLL